MAQKKHTTIEIRDQRQGNWVWVHKVILFDMRVSASDYKVYSGLASYADNTEQNAWPSIPTLADNLNIGRATVIRSLKNLESIGAIDVERREGTSNVYTLLDVSEVNGEVARRKPKGTPPEKPKEIYEATPAEKNRHFFESVEAGDFAAAYQVFKPGSVTYEKVQAITHSEQYRPWFEQQLIRFCNYWREKNKSGTKEKWEQKGAFEVERRLSTWFANHKERFNTAQTQYQKRGKEIIV